jgi:hypothetical protein
MGQDMSDKVAAAEDGDQVQSRTSKIYLADSRFSNCIYEEMQIDEIKREYEKAVAEKEQYEEALKSGSLEDNIDVQYFMKRI